MENLLSRYRNASILVGVLLAQVLGLAIQVRRTTGNESSRLIRVWAVGTISPFQKAIIWMESGTGGIWHNYIYLRGVRKENRDLKQEIERLRLERVRLSEDAEQAKRLQALLQFKEGFITKTVAAQVIGSSGTDQSRAVFIDKGSDDGIKRDMAVITADGVVGKVLTVYGSTSLVLLINDASSGVGAIFEKSRLQGVLKGTSSGELIVDKVMTDEAVEPGEIVRTSGGDQVFLKGLPAGTVTSVSKNGEMFRTIHIRPTARLNRLEEVLVITQKEERVPDVSAGTPLRAADILARRLPSVPDKPKEEPKRPVSETDGATQPTGPAVKPKPIVSQAPPANAPPPQAGGAEASAGEVPKAVHAAPQSLVKVSETSATPKPVEAKPKEAPPQPQPPSQEKPQ